MAGRRLVLGITNVGVWVVAASGGLFWLVRGGTKTHDVRWYFLIAIGSLVTQSVFDVVGGTVLMPAPRPNVPKFLRGWLQGMIVHTLVLAVVGALSYASFRLTGGYVCAIALAMSGQVLARRFFLRFIGGAPTKEVAQDGTSILTASAADPGFHRRDRWDWTPCRQLMACQLAGEIISRGTRQ